MKQKLKVKAVDVLVPDYDAMDQGVRRFIGWKFDPLQGLEYTDPKTLQKKHQGAWVRTEKIVEVNSRPEYLAEIKAGNLILVDDAHLQENAKKVLSTLK